VYLESIWALDRLLDWFSQRGPKEPAKEKRHILIAATGNGNIGDQAMLEAYLENVNGDVIVVCESLAYMKLPVADEGRATLVALPRLVRGTAGLRLPEVLTFNRLLREGKSLSVTGADLMDGLYNPAASVARASALRSATSAGVPARVLGFSWSPHPHVGATRAMRRLRGDAALFARDPISAERLSGLGIQGVELVADTVFAATGVDRASAAAEWAAAKKAQGKRIAIVNASALIAQRVGQLNDYVAIVDYLLSEDYAIVLVPHVVRPGDNDVTPVREIFAKFSSADLYLVETELSPRQVRGLVAFADSVVTGRMHLAVMSLMAGVVPITLGTQGKVDGLYALFSIENFTVEPSPGFSAKVIAGLAPAARADPDARLPQVAAASSLNFEGLA